VDLLLAGALALGLALGTGHEVFLLLTGESSALWELLAAALVGLADVLGGKRELPLGQLGEVSGVGLALVLRLGLGGVFSVLLDGVLLFSLGDGLASLFVSQLSVTVVSAPAVCGLLVVVAGIC
jgi:hypothetical protein